jgi:hypothetical protein
LSRAPAYICSPRTPQVYAFELIPTFRSGISVFKLSLPQTG